MDGLAALRLLVIDDNEQMRSIIGTVLRAAGIRHLEFAADGRDGLDIIVRGGIDAVYVDQEMPVMNGLDFVLAVRQLPTQDRYLPIIMLTGHSERRRAEMARDMGVTEFLCKPVTANTIVGRLNTLIMNPRPFVFSDSYFGPDRRRHRLAGYAGRRRRLSDRAEAVVI